MTRPTFEQAKRNYIHRHTMEHVPAWARIPCEGNGKYYAPQYATDAQWYDVATFPTEAGHLGGRDHCQTTAQTWPLGHWLDAPMTFNRDSVPFDSLAIGQVFRCNGNAYRKRSTKTAELIDLTRWFYFKNDERVTTLN